MTLESLVEAAKSALKNAVGRASRDRQADRATVLQDLHLAEKAWASGDGHPWFAQDGEQVAFSPASRGGTPLTIGGQTTTFVPADRFADYLRSMRDAIDLGVFDDEIAGALQGLPAGGVADVALPPARDGDPADVRRAQQAAALAQEGRNPDGSLKAIFGDRGEAPDDRLPPD